MAGGALDDEGVNPQGITALGAGKLLTARAGSRKVPPWHPGHWEHGDRPPSHASQPTASLQWQSPSDQLTAPLLQMRRQAETSSSLAGSQCRTADGVLHTAEPAVSSAPDHRGRHQEPPCPHCIGLSSVGQGWCCVLCSCRAHTVRQPPGPPPPEPHSSCTSHRWPAHLPTPSNTEPQYLLCGNEPTRDRGRPTSLPVAFPPSGLRSSQGQSPHFTTLRPAQHSPESAAGLLVSQSGTSTSVAAPRNATP